jgi:NADH-quinone oxidoreductase subunit A
LETGYISIFWLMIISCLTVPLMLGIGWILRPRSRMLGKGGLAYECGEDPVGPAWVQFNIRFYVVAIVFIVFDVELVALLPVATLFKQAVATGNGAVVFVEIFLFVGLLLAGLLYCWVRGDLEWVKGILKIAPQK